MKALCSFVGLIALVIPWVAVAQQTSAPTEQSTVTPPPDSAATGVAIGAPYDWYHPSYPKHALQNKIQGSVVLRLSVNEEGRVTSIGIVRGDPEFIDAATRAARKWRYSPCFRDNKPVKVTTLVTIDFKLDASGHPNINAKYEQPALDGVLKVGGEVRPPRVIHAEDPAYSEEARQEKYEGPCVLALVVGPDGRPYNIRVARPLGKGLDEKAIEAVSNWKFEPARKDGRPVAVMINVEVQFRLSD